jgi:hypothetical protein
VWVSLKASKQASIKPPKTKQNKKKEARPWLCECVCRSGLKLGVGEKKKSPKHSATAFITTAR